MVGASRQYVFLAGMPRAGSTVLSALLEQNPAIHAEGMSAVCQLMWDLNVSCRDRAFEELIAAGRAETVVRLISSVPSIYYEGVDRPVIVDKNRGWCNPTNVEMIRRFIDPSPRIIVLDRSLDAVVDSFVRLGERNGITIPRESLLAPGTDPVMSAFENVREARRVDSGEYLFVEYEDFVADPRAVLSSIYEFCGWEPFDHDYANISSRHVDTPGVYLDGLHEIRPLERERV